MIRKSSIGIGIIGWKVKNDIVFCSEAKKIEAIEIKGNANIKGKYFPDAVSDNTDYEVEVVPRKHYLVNKAEKWDEKRKKVLVLRPNSFAYEKFDEIYVFNNNS